MKKVVVRKYGAGQSFAVMEGPAEYAEQAKAALMRAFTTRSVIIEEQFRQLMRASGVPDQATDQFLAAARIDDEAYLTDEPRH